MGNTSRGTFRPAVQALRPVLVNLSGYDALGLPDLAGCNDSVPCAVSMPMSASWPRLQPRVQESNGKGSLGCKLWPLDKHVTFKHVTDFEPRPQGKAPSHSTPKGKSKWNARVRAPSQLYQGCLFVTPGLLINASYHPARRKFIFHYECSTLQHAARGAERQSLMRIKMV